MKKMILFSTFLLMFVQACNNSGGNRDQQREPGQEKSEVPNKDINFTPANN